MTNYLPIRNFIFSYRNIPNNIILRIMQLKMHVVIKKLKIIMIKYGKKYNVCRKELFLIT